MFLSLGRRCRAAHRGHGAGVLLCNDDGTPAEATASELGEWCGAGKTPLAFLHVCKAGQTASRGSFGGVAQQLLNPRGGNLAALKMLLDRIWPVGRSRPLEIGAPEIKQPRDLLTVMEAVTNAS